MEEMKGPKQIPKKPNPARRILRLVATRISRGNVRRPSDPWARIRERKGYRTLVWGAGDGKTFGSVPLGPEVAFSVDAEGVKLRSGAGDPVLIGSPGNENANILLSRKIEKVLRSQGRRAMIVWSGVFALVFLIVLEVSGGAGLERFASFAPAVRLSGDGGLSGSFPGSGGGFPPSMSSGLTCNTH